MGPSGPFCHKLIESLLRANPYSIWTRSVGWIGPRAWLTFASNTNSCNASSWTWVHSHWAFFLSKWYKSLAITEKSGICFLLNTSSLNVCCRSSFDSGILIQSREDRVLGVIQVIPPLHQIPKNFTSLEGACIFSGRIINPVLFKWVIMSHCASLTSSVWLPPQTHRLRIDKSSPPLVWGSFLIPALGRGELTWESAYSPGEGASKCTAVPPRWKRNGFDLWVEGEHKKHVLNINSCQNQVPVFLNGANELGSVNYSSV